MKRVISSVNRKYYLHGKGSNVDFKRRRIRNAKNSLDRAADFQLRAQIQKHKGRKKKKKRKLLQSNCVSKNQIMLLAGGADFQTKPTHDVYLHQPKPTLETVLQFPSQHAFSHFDYKKPKTFHEQDQNIKCFWQYTYVYILNVDLSNLVFMFEFFLYGFLIRFYEVCIIKFSDQKVIFHMLYKGLVDLKQKK